MRNTVFDSDITLCSIWKLTVITTIVHYRHTVYFISYNAVQIRPRALRTLTSFYKQEKILKLTGRCGERSFHTRAPLGHANLSLQVVGNNILHAEGSKRGDCRRRRLHPGMAQFVPPRWHRGCAGAARMMCRARCRVPRQGCEPPLARFVAREYEISREVKAGKFTLLAPPVPLD